METNQAAKQMHIMVPKEIKYVMMSWQKQKNMGSPFFCTYHPGNKGMGHLQVTERLLWPLHSNIVFPMTWDQLRPNSDRLQLYLRIFSVVLQQMRTNGWNQTTCWLWYTSSNECSQILVSFSHGTFPPFHLHFAKRDLYLAHHHFIHMKYRNSTYISQQGTTPEYHRPSLREELPSPDSYCNIRRSQWLWHC